MPPFPSLLHSLQRKSIATLARSFIQIHLELVIYSTVLVPIRTLYLSCEEMSIIEWSGSSSSSSVNRGEFLTVSLVSSCRLGRLTKEKFKKGLLSRRFMTLCESSSHKQFSSSISSLLSVYSTLSTSWSSSLVNSSALCSKSVNEPCALSGSKEAVSASIRGRS